MQHKCAWLASYLVRARRALVVRVSDNQVVLELRQEAANLVRHDSERSRRGGTARMASVQVSGCLRSVQRSTGSRKNTAVVAATIQKHKRESSDAYPSGWCSSETISSTARQLAMNETPGRVTVHCWSSVRLVVDCIKSVSERMSSLAHHKDLRPHQVYVHPVVQPHHCKSSSPNERTADQFAQSRCSRTCTSGHDASPQRYQSRAQH